MSHDHIDIQAYPFFRERGKPTVVILSPPVFNNDILTFGIAQIMKPCTKGVHIGSEGRCIARVEKTDPREFLWRLRARRASGQIAAPVTSARNLRRFIGHRCIQPR